MIYTLQRLISDVMGRLGETAQPSPSDIPGPGDIIALRVESLLPEIGERLLLEAPFAMLGEGMPIATETTSRLMPCGLYAAEVGMPEDFVRFVSAKMDGWGRSVERIICAVDAEWGCQWSEEEGIAGCAARPRAYMVVSEAGRRLRLMGNVSASTTIEWMRVWVTPYAPEFHFPSALYPQLIKEICKTATGVFQSD